MTSVSIELGMPTSPDLGKVRRRLDRLVEGVGRVVLTDNHAATARMSPLAAVAAVLESGRRCTVCASTRDRNHLALFAHVTGAAALGADEVLCVGGDRVDGIPARDLRVTALIEEAGDWVNPATRVGAGCEAHLDRDGAPTRLTRRKVEAGASFLVTQAIYDAGQARAVAEAIAGLGAEPVIGLPLVTTPGALAALARYTGEPPPWVVEQVEAGSGAAVTRELLDALDVERVHVYPVGPGAWEAAAEVLEA